MVHACRAVLIMCVEPQDWARELEDCEVFGADPRIGGGRRADMRLSVPLSPLDRPDVGACPSYARTAPLSAFLSKLLAMAVT